MKKNFALLLLFAGILPLQGQDLTGAWNGALDINGTKLRLVFHLEASAEGYTGKMDSPDQGVNGIPVQEITFEEGKLTIRMPNLLLEYSGQVGADGNAVEGTFKQSGLELPLKLVRGGVEQPKRPQNPVPPFPYRAEDVTYPNETAGFNLAGTLTIPNGEGPFPAAILISGSGAQNRDEELLGHKPFLVLADHLTRNGIAVLRFDDRGVGASGGNHSTATSADFATDVAAGIDYLLSRSEIDPARIGLIGHSEGGMIAPLTAVGRNDVAFVVLLAGPGVPGNEILPHQQQLIAEAEGTPQASIDANQQVVRKAIDLIRQGDKPLDELKEIMRPELEGLLKNELPEENINQAIEAQLNILFSPWMQFFLTHDPRPVLEKLTCPVLALNGEKDLQVDPAQNLPEIEKALQKGGNRQYKVEMLPGLNHLFQTTQTGKTSEYAQIEETFSPNALTVISEWVNAVTKR